MLQSTIRAETTVHALPTTIWKVLTNPEYTRQYLLDCYLVSLWVEQEEVIGYIEEEDESRVLFKGRVEEVSPGQRLSFTLEAQREPAQRFQLSYRFLPEQCAINLTMEVQHFGNEHIITREICRDMLSKIKWLAEYF